MPSQGTGTSAQGEPGHTFEVECASLAVWCTAAVKEYMRGHRAKAKRTLTKLATEHPDSYVPHRYLARVLYHEASVQEVHGGSGTERLALLTEALRSACRATELNPHSLSSVALRATLVVNILVEESALQSGMGEGSASPLKKSFQTAMTVCQQAASTTTPTMAEPVINISDGGSQTCDPCSLRVQDQILQWVREGRWDCVVQEKRNVLVCMQQVLQSCHTLLDSTQIPVDGVVRLLQHILRSLLPHRPAQADLPPWSQLLGNPAASLPDAQLLLQAQQTLLQQGQQLQQLSSQCKADASAASPQDTAAVAPSASTTNTANSQPATRQPVLAAAAAKPKQSADTLKSKSAPPPQPPPPPGPEPPSASQALFEERDWDWDKELGGAAAGGGSAGVAPQSAATTTASTAAARRRGRAKPHGKPVSANPRCKERSHRERYMDVEAFWCSLQPEQRMELLRVPLGPLLQCMRSEVGQEAVEDVCESLVLLQEQGMRSACVWTCVMCDQKFTHAKDFLQHIEIAHEEVAVQGGKYVMCGKCQVEVVGMYYTSTCVADYSLCARCFQQESASVPEISSAYERIYPRAPSVNGPQRWSDSGSDFISTRDSFTSTEEGDQLEGPATPKAAHLEGSGKQWSPLRQTVSGATARNTQRIDRALGLPAWAATAQQRQQPTSRQHSTGGSSSTASSPSDTGRRAQLLSILPKGIGLGQSGPVTQHTYSSRSSGLPSGDAGQTQHLGLEGMVDAGSLLSSWWPKRLLKSWGSSGSQSAPDKGQGKDGSGSGAAPGLARTSLDAAPPTPPPAGTNGPGGAAGAAGAIGRRRSTSERVAEAPKGIVGSCCGPDGADRDVRGQRGTACAPCGLGVDGTFDDVGADSAQMSAASVSERHQLVVVVEEIVQRIRDVYGCNHAVGDMALGSIMQFTERKLSALVKHHGLPVDHPGSTAAHQQLEEFLAKPACVFRKPEVLRCALRCLPLTDLHMVLVYVVRQHADASGEDPGGAPAAAMADGPGVAVAVAAPGEVPGHLFRPARYRARRQLGMDGVDVAAKAGLVQAPALSGVPVTSLCVSGREEDEDEEEDDSVESSCDCDEDDDDEEDDDNDDDDEDDDEEEDEEDEDDDDDDDDVDDVAPPPLFELHVPNMAALHAIIADAWHRDEAEEAGPVTSNGNCSNGGGKPAPLSKGPPRLESVDLDDFLLMAGLQLEGVKSSALDVHTHPWLAPTSWWISHLIEHPASSSTPLPSQPSTTPANRRPNPSSTTNPAATAYQDAGAQRVLLWAYGKVVNTATQAFLTRQREYRAGRERDTALLDLYDDLAYGWRSLQAALDQRARLEELRKGARAQFAMVRHIEEEARHCHAEEAAEFLEVLMTSHQAAIVAASEAGAPPEHPRLNMCEAAVDVVRRHPALAGEPSQRYARALLDRELSALLLVEAMLAAEVEECTRARAAAEDALRKHRSEVRDTEAEYTRLEAEGPACHRKKDLLDKATKEAEHRERIQDLQQRLIAVTERISNEDANRIKWNDRLVEAERDLRAVRDQLRQHSTRRKHLDELCAQLEVPMPPALMQQQLGAASPPEAARPTDLTPLPPSTPALDATAPSMTTPADAPVPSVTSPPTDPATSSPANPTPQVSPISPTSPTQSSAQAVPAPSTSTPALATTLTPVSVTAVTAGPIIPLSSSSPSAAAIPLTLEEWHKQRLEVLMYRLMWVSEAVKNFQDQYSPHARTRHYELFLKATSWAKSLADEYETQVRGWYNELDKLREKLLEQACMDLGLILGQHMLEIVRRRIETAARMAQEKASLLLLQELEQEESSANGTTAAGTATSNGVVGGSGAGGGGKNTSKNARKQKVAEKAKEKKDREEAERQARAVELEAKRRAADEERLRLAEARRAREEAIEAELERRRKELEALEAHREAEAIRLAQEASLKEAFKAAQRAAQAKEEQEKATAVKHMQPTTAAAALSQTTHPANGNAAATVATGAVQTTAAVAGGKQLGVARNSWRPGRSEAMPAKAVTAATSSAQPDTASVSQSAAAVPGSKMNSKANGDIGTGATRMARLPQQRVPAVLATAAPVPPPPAPVTAAATAEIAGAAAVMAAPPRPANKHAPKFTSTTAAAVAHHPRNGSYAGGRAAALAAAATGDSHCHSNAKLPPMQHQQQQHPVPAPRMAAAVRAPTGLPAPSAIDSTVPVGSFPGRPKSVGETNVQQPPTASPVARVSLSMPQTPEQRSMPGTIPAPACTSTSALAMASHTAAAQTSTAAFSPYATPAANTPPPSSNVTQHNTPRQMDMLSGMFNPFAENPILRALQPERVGSPSPPLPPLTSPQHTPHPSQLTSPRSPPQTLSNPPPPHFHPGAGTAYTLHSQLHGMGVHTPLSLAPATPSSAAEPATEHILSIMSILEPDAHSAHSPVAPYAFKSQGSSVGGSNSAGSSKLGQAAAGLQTPVGQAGTGMSSEGMSTKPTTGHAILTGLAQASGYSIWSNHAPATGDGLAADSWALPAAAATANDGGMPGPGHQAVVGGRGHNTRLVVSTLSSSAAPWTGGSGASSSAGALGFNAGSMPHHTMDMASLLPASLLPASLEPDTVVSGGSSGGGTQGAGRLAMKEQWQSGGALPQAPLGMGSDLRAASPWGAEVYMPMHGVMGMGRPGFGPGKLGNGPGFMGSARMHPPVLPDPLWGGGLAQSGAWTSQSDQGNGWSHADQQQQQYGGSPWPQHH